VSATASAEALTPTAAAVQTVSASDSAQPITLTAVTFKDGTSTASILPGAPVELSAAPLRPLTPESLRVLGFKVRRETRDVLVVTLYSRMTRFHTGQDKIRPAAMEELKAAATVLKTFDLARWRVDGHADRRGRASLNLDLSRRRAWEVAMALVNLGMPSDKMTGAFGWSSKRPLVKGNSAEALGYNRRVELRLTGK
jgi:outer membrane protein OmpA-like peptidoglycan-associated protein